MNGKPLTDVERALLTKHYADSKTEDLATVLGRSVENIYGFARRLGLKKSEAFQASEAGGRLRPGNTLGKAYQFKAGKKPWNSGKKIALPDSCKATQFKPGSRPHTWMPVGSHRVNGDGYLEVKLNDDPGPYFVRWTPVHRKLWIEAHGEPPAGFVVAFKPGRKTTVLEELTLDCLELLSKADMARRNVPSARYPKEVAQLIQLKGAIKRVINRRERDAATTQGPKDE